MPHWQIFQRTYYNKDPSSAHGVAMKSRVSLDAVKLYKRIDEHIDTHICFTFAIYIYFLRRRRRVSCLIRTDSRFYDYVQCILTHNPSGSKCWPTKKLVTNS